MISNRWVALASALAMSLSLLACHGPVAPTDGGVAGDGGPSRDWCALPGTWQFRDAGATLVPGGRDGGDDLAYLMLLPGFCAHRYGQVGNARQLRFAPGGELFVASPTQLTTGGGPGGESAIVILPDDDRDGEADAPITFLGNLPQTQGMLFARDHFFYYQDGTQIMRMPYQAGDRAPRPAQQVADIQFYVSPLHWPKPLAQADDGTIYVGNGGDQGDACASSDPSHPFHGGILALEGDGGVRQVAKGLRNPIGMRCARGHDRCFACELAKDYTGDEGGREKLIPIRQGDDWGFPCCASRGLPYADSPIGADCSGVTADTDSFTIGDTPMDVDFEPGLWGPPWTGAAFVSLHGAYTTWQGARIVSVAMDPRTGLPEPGTTLDGGRPTGAMRGFAAGWYEDVNHAHGRPSALAFSRDGRLFVANDATGEIIWIAQMR